MEKEIKRLEMHKKILKTRFYLHPLLYIAASFSLASTKHKIIKENFKTIKGGCLVVSNHMSFEDVKFLIKILWPRRANYISSIDEFCGKEWLMRRIGCIPKKVHFTDMAIVRMMVRILKQGRILALYPEATYSFAGCTNAFDQDLGKLAKLANVPVIVIHEEGNYLYSPRWNTLPKNKEVPLIARAKMVVNSDEVKTLKAEEIQNRINEYFKYDEYQYQRDNKIAILNKTMAHNIDRILYLCPHCLKEKTIIGENNDIKCSNCNASYHIDQYSILKNVNGETKFDSISKWYTWQREFVKKDLENNNYHIEFPIKISRFLNPKLGFDHNYGKGMAIQDEHGIHIVGKVKDNDNFIYEYNEKLNSLIHLTFDVKGCQESAFEVHNEKESYLIYPLDKTPIVKIRFAVEEAHALYLNKLNK